MVPKVAIIGAGLAGLSCARALQQAGLPWVIYEAKNRIGGRVATDEVDGFLLDHGFQVLLTNYPEVQKQLDDRRLKLRRFYPGAMIRCEGKWYRMADPLRRPIDAIAGIWAPIGRFSDKLRIVCKSRGGYDLSRHGSNLSSLQALRAEGFSEVIINRFFRPFLSGVFLEKELSTQVRKLDFVMNHFSLGDTAVPARGMAEIPRQLAESLPQTAIQRSSPVIELSGMTVRLANGESLTADAIVLATDAGTAAKLMHSPGPQPAFHSTACLYFSCIDPPSHEPILWLNGDGGPINHLAVMSSVSSDYAPAGKHLIAVNVIDPQFLAMEHLESLVRSQLRDWYGSAADDWQHLRTDRISQALPIQDEPSIPHHRIRSGIYQCGDHMGLASIESALASGARVAAMILDDFCR